MDKFIKEEDFCWCNSNKKYKDCHFEIDKKIKLAKLKGIKVPSHSLIKNEFQISKIKDSGKINIAVLDKVTELIKPGMTTNEIDKIIYETTTQLGGICAPLNYEGYPKSVCTSINDEVCHGIPSNRIIKETDIINVDVSTILDGYFSDSSRMFCMPKAEDYKISLSEVCRQSIQIGLDEVKPFAQIGNIGAAIHEFAKKHGYSVVAEVGGHGVGLQFHEDPFVSFVSKRNTGMLMVPGMIFTIEPMINFGRPDVYLDSSNNWTIKTYDQKPSAQWEVMVLVTDDGYEILAY